jgi:hypothetical protein
MKTIAMILLGLMLSAPVEAGEETIHDTHLGCEAWATIGIPAESGRDVVIGPGTGRDAVRGAGTFGFIAGFAAATPGLHLPKTHGETVDAVCRSIDLHPAMWKLPQTTGLSLILHDLYGEPSKESK